MTVFSELFNTSAIPVQFHLHGQAVTYVSGGVSTALTAIVSDVSIDPDSDLRGLVSQETRSIQFSTDPASDWGGVASPKESATITVGSTSWAIQNLEVISSSLVRARCVRHESVERSRPALRGGAE